MYFNNKPLRSGKYTKARSFVFGAHRQNIPSSSSARGLFKRVFSSRKTRAYVPPSSEELEAIYDEWRRYENPMYGMLIRAQENADVIAQRLFGYSKSAIAAAGKRLEEFTGTALDRIPSQVAWGFAGTVATQVARGVPFRQAVESAARAAGRFGQRAFDYSFRPR